MSPGSEGSNPRSTIGATGKTLRTLVPDMACDEILHSQGVLYLVGSDGKVYSGSSYTGALTANGWSAHSGAGNKIINSDGDVATLDHGAHAELAQVVAQLASGPARGLVDQQEGLGVGVADGASPPIGSSRSRRTTSV